MNVLTKEIFINNNTFSSCLHSKDMVLHAHLSLSENMLLCQSTRWRNIVPPNWALNFPKLGSLRYLEPSLVPSHRALMALASHWHHNLTWVCVDSRPTGPLHFLLFLWWSLRFFLAIFRCCLDWRSWSLALGSQFLKGWMPLLHKSLKRGSPMLTFKVWFDMSTGRMAILSPIFLSHHPTSSWVRSLWLCWLLRLDHSPRGKLG